LVDEVWGADKPGMPHEKVYVLADKYTGQTVQDKYKNIAAKMPKDVDMMLVTPLDDIAWMLNLRGNDIQYNPLFFSYVLFHRVGEENFKVDLFIDADKVSEPEVMEHMKVNQITVYPYDGIATKIEEYSLQEKKKISVDKSQCNQRLFSLLEEQKYEVVPQEHNIIELLKACKNSVQ